MYGGSVGVHMSPRSCRVGAYVDVPKWLLGNHNHHQTGPIRTSGWHAFNFTVFFPCVLSFSRILPLTSVGHVSLNAACNADRPAQLEGPGYHSQISCPIIHSSGSSNCLNAFTFTPHLLSSSTPRTRIPLGEGTYRELHPLVFSSVPGVNGTPAPPRTRTSPTALIPKPKMRNKQQREK